MRTVLSVFLLVVVAAASFNPGASKNEIPLAGPARGEGQPATLDEYWDQVQKTRSVVDGLQTASAEAARQSLDYLIQEWESIAELKLNDGTVIPIDNSELTTLLRHDPPVFTETLARLDALLAARSTFPNNKFSQKDLDALAAILAEPQFQWGQDNTVQPPDWWTRFWDTISRWLEALFNRFGFSLPGSDTVMTWGLVIVLLVVLFFMFRTLLRDLAGDEELHPEGEAGLEPLTAEAAIQRAQELSGLGNYRSAVRYLYLSALLLLDERGVLRYDRSRTNREVLRNVAETAELARPLRAVIDLFDRVWYGYEPINQSTYDEYVRHVDKLKEFKL